LEYNVAEWGSFFAAASAASGALLGLMITAVTVRLSLLEGSSSIANRNYQLVIVLFDVLAYSLFPLAPIGRIAVGVLLFVFGADALRGFIFFLLLPSWRQQLNFRPALKVLESEQGISPSMLGWFAPLLLSPPVVLLLAPIPLVAGSISLAVRWGGGLYWAAPGLVMALGYVVIFLWAFIIEPRPEGSPETPGQTQ
jgi:hypothetical protein